MTHPLTLAAIDVSQVIGISLLVITVLGWFVNFVQGNTPDGGPRQQRPKPKQTGRSEIEELLQELSGEKRRPKSDQPPRPSKPQPERAKAKPKPPPLKPGNQPAVSASRSNARVATGLPSAHLGEGIRSHQLANQIDIAVQKEITAAVQHDLGNRIAPAAPIQEKQVHPLVKILRDPNGVRQAVLLNEILQRPKATRHEHHV